MTNTPGIGGRPLSEAEMREQELKQGAPVQPPQTPVLKRPNPPPQDLVINKELFPEGSSETIEKAAIGVRDWIDNTFQGDKRSKQQIADDRAESFSEFREKQQTAQEAIDADTSFGAEAIRAGVGGVAGAVEMFGEGAELIGDAAKSAVGLAEAKDIPWHESYESADWDLGTAENKTAVGKFARNIISMAIGMRWLKVAGVGIGGQQTVASRLASETLRGGLLDFFADPGDGNLSNLVEGSWFATPLSAALAHDEEDNQIIRRLKNLAEGGTIGITVDALSEVYGVLRAGMRAKGTPEQKLAEGLNSPAIKIYHGGGARRAQAIKDGTGLQSRAKHDHPMGEGIYVTTDEAYASWYGTDVSLSSDPFIPNQKGSPKLLDLREQNIIDWAEEQGIGRPEKLLEATEDELGMGLPDTKMWSNRQQKLIKKRITDQGYDGVRFFDPWKTTTKDEEIVFYNEDLANKLLGVHKTRVSANYVPEFSNKLKRKGDTTGVTSSSSKKTGRVLWYFERTPSGTIEVNWGTGSRGKKQKGTHPIAQAKSDFQDMIRNGRFRIGEILENSPMDDLPGESGATDRALKAFEEGPVMKEKNIEIENKIKELIDETKAQEQTQRAQDLIGDANEYYLNDAFESREGIRDWEELTPDEQKLYLRKAAIHRPEVRRLDREKDKIIQETEGLQFPNKRARLYRRFGFGPMDERGIQRGMIVDGPDGIELKPIDPETGQIFELSRKAENDLNSARVGQEGTFEPNERARIVGENSIEDAAASQYERYLDDVFPGGTKHHLSDADFNKMTTVEDFQTYLKEHYARIDVDEVARKLRLQPKDVQLDAWAAIVDWLSGGRMNKLEALRKVKTGRGLQGFDAEGVVALKTIMEETNEQLLDLAENLEDLNWNNVELTTQAQAFITRTRALVKMLKEETTLSAFKLMDHQTIPPNVRQSFDASVEFIEKEFNKIDAIFKEGNPDEILAGKETLMGFARGMIASNGDLTQWLGFWGSVRRQGVKQINQAVISSWLSSPISQMRNLAGNTLVAIERPFAMAIGHMWKGETAEARAALSMFDSIYGTVRESMGVARKSFGSKNPLTEGSKLAEVYGDGGRQLERLEKLAKTSTEKGVVTMMRMHYDLINSPWVNWPGKGLQAGDDLFKSIVARQDLRYKAMLDVEKYKETGGVRQALANDKYGELLQKYIGPNGQILDIDETGEQLLRSAKEATFQADLEGPMREVANTLNKLPIGKQFFPFLKTPHNVNVYALQHIPGFARFSGEWDRIITKGKGTAQEQALLRGRVAIGYMTWALGFGLAANGNITGNGPVGKKEKELWLRTHQPMSFRAPWDKNKWISYRSIPGADMIFSAIADAHLIRDLVTEEEFDRIGGQFTFSVANSLTNRSYFQGFVDLAGVLDTGSWTPKMMARGAGDRLDSVIPILGGSGLRTQLSRALHPGMFEYRNNLHAIMGRVTGGVSGFIPGATVPTIDVLTGEQMLTGYEGWSNSVNPFRVANKGVSPVVENLNKYQFPLGRMLISKVGDMELTTEEQQFLNKELYSKGGFPTALQTEMNSERFKNRYKLWERNKGTADGEARESSQWYRDLQAVVRRYRKKAERELKFGSSEISQKYRERLATPR